MKSILLGVALGALLAACTLVSIEGDGNSVSDTGGHGGGLTLPQQQSSVAERLRTLHDSQ